MIPDENDMALSDKKEVYASFWERLAAAFLDGLVLMVINFFVSFLFEDDDYDIKFPATDFNVINPLIKIIVGWLYTALQECSPVRATLGKRAMGLQVTDLYGARISFLRATGRYFSKLLSALILFIGYFMMIWDDRKQTLHDKIAGTLVVRN